MRKRKDRISELPDVLLSHVISFLDTKWAFRTTVLAKRWRNLVWNSLSTLHFEESHFRRLWEFEKFIYDVLRRRDKTLPLYKLIFTFEERTYCSWRIHRYIRDYARTDALQHLEICIPLRYAAGIGGVLYSVLHETLRVVKLYARHTLSKTNLCTLRGLPKLEILHLRGFGIERNRLSEFENLVELSIVHCEMDRSGIIRAPQLSSLKISNFYNSASPDHLKVRLMAPKLTTFILKSSPYEIPEFQTDEFFHLKTARLKMTINYGEREIMMNLLEKLCYAQHVSLTLLTFELLHKIGSAPEVPASPFSFSNLKTFRITVSDKIEYGEMSMRHKGISTSDINQVLNTVFQSSSDVVSIVHFPRTSKCPRI